MSSLGPAPAHFDLSTLSPQAQRVLGPGAPGPLRAMAARGAVPGLKPAEIVTVIVLLARDQDENVSSLAATTLAKLPAPLLKGALGADLDGMVIEALAAAYGSDAQVVEQLLRLPRLSGPALELLAERATEVIGELIATNEQRMLQFPTVIEKLYLNKRVRMSTADRLIELAVRNGLELSIPAFKEAAQAILNELIPEPSPEPTFDDVVFNEAERLASQIPLAADDEDTHAVDDEGEERVRTKFLPLFAQLAEMTTSQKIRRALIGSPAERLLLIRDSNRLVAVAAAKSPGFREPEAALISASRAVSEDVLRAIAQNPEFTRNYTIKKNLVGNPRTPFTFAARLITHLRDNDLKTLARSKNVSGAIVQAAQQHLVRKSSGKK
jgi:hypothetical protein